MFRKSTRQKYKSLRSTASYLPSRVNLEYHSLLVLRSSEHQRHGTLRRTASFLVLTLGSGIMPSYSSDQFHKDWVYACAQDFKSSDGQPADWAQGQPSHVGHS